MIIERVQPARVWKNKQTGQTASIYGAVPWTSAADEPNWEIVKVGWTWVRSDGCVGLGRKPAETEAEALEVMRQFNSRRTR